MNGVIDFSAVIAGMGMSGSRASRSYEVGEGYGPYAIPAAKTGSLTTRTDDDTGVITFGAGHGFEVNDLVDVYWAAGVRYWMKVTDVTGNAVTVDDPGAAESGGDVLPAESTAMLGCERIESAVSFDGDDMSMFAAWMSKRGHFQFLDASNASLWASELKANELLPWLDTWPYTLPITGNPVAKVRYTCGEAAASEFRFAVLWGSAL